MLSSQWLLMLFLLALPPETVLRAWDLLFAFGRRALLGGGLATLKLVAADLEQSTTFEQAYSICKALHVPALDCDAFVRATLTEVRSLDPKRLRAVRQPHLDAVLKETAAREQRRQEMDAQRQGTPADAACSARGRLGRIAAGAAGAATGAAGAATGAARAAATSATSVTGAAVRAILPPLARCVNYETVTTVLVLLNDLIMLVVLLLLVRAHTPPPPPPPPPPPMRVAICQHAFAC